MHVTAGLGPWDRFGGPDLNLGSSLERGSGAFQGIRPPFHLTIYNASWEISNIVMMVEIPYICMCALRQVCVDYRV